MLTYCILSPGLISDLLVVLRSMFQGQDSSYSSINSGMMMMSDKRDLLILEYPPYYWTLIGILK